MIVAVMQPYFFPYPGYFRLFQAADLFVIYDCVQFPRRGYVHRNRLAGSGATPKWLTLALAGAPQSTLIRDLRFAEDAGDRLAACSRAFPSLVAGANHDLVRACFELAEAPIDYLERTLQLTCSLLGIECEVIRSSSLNVPRSLCGQERVMEIARLVGATSYVNPPGGTELYDPRAFHGQGLSLGFLRPFRGSHLSVLEQVLTRSERAVSEDVTSQALPRWVTPA